ncbi:ZCHC3 protein, partial [Amia calva]|nr:ZCHC3 protein [Amia calva]
KTVNVVTFSELAKMEDIYTWLAQYCSVYHGSSVRDADGVKTGAYRFQVRLNKDTVNGGLCHLPSTIQIGACRGYAFYLGQPKVCRCCGTVGHFAATCTIVSCKIRGKKGHLASNCTKPLKCNLCSSQEHVFKNCPYAYANKVKTNTMAEMHKPVKRRGITVELSSDESDQEVVQTKLPQAPEPTPQTFFQSANPLPSVGKQAISPADELQLEQPEENANLAQPFSAIGRLPATFSMSADPELPLLQPVDGVQQPQPSNSAQLDQTTPTAQHPADLEPPPDFHLLAAPKQGETESSAVTSPENSKDLFSLPLGQGQQDWDCTQQVDTQTLVQDFMDIL